jgi:uncharacterized protein YjbJ (UPF0337 family)
MDAAKARIFNDKERGKPIAQLWAMNWQQVENHWQQFKGFAKRRWQKLTDDDLTAIGGRRAALIKRLEDYYAMSPKEAGERADQWLRLSQDAETVEIRPAAYGSSPFSRPLP